MKTIKLKEIMTVNQGLQIPIANRDRIKTKENYFYITIQFLKDSGEKYYVTNPPPQTICNKNDILVTRTGSTGQIITGVEGCFHNNFFKLNFDATKINGRYLYWWLNSDPVQDKIKSMAGLTVIPDLNHGSFLDLDFPIISMDKQNNIASILDSLEKKIFINDSVILESQIFINTLYNYWFTQFDFPDENGKPYKSSGGKMVWNEKLKRDIPEGWEVQTLLKNEISEIVGGGVEPYDGTKEYLATADIDGNGALEGELLSYDERPNRANMSPIKNSVWVAKMADSPKRLFFTDDSNLIDKYIISTGMFAFTSNEEHYEYLMMYLFSDHFEKLKDRFAQGATQRAINQANLSLFPIVIPEENILKQFHNLTKDMVRKIELLKEENIELKKQRDFLLPLLMNGQVTIK